MSSKGKLAAKRLGWGDGIKSPAIIWEGNGLDEVGRRGDTKEIIIRIDPRYFRPTEVEQLLGDASKAKKKLGWSQKISLEDLVHEMVDSDLEKAKKVMYLKKQGFQINNSYDS